ncbi:MAG: T9SS type A sorting domain-containing protein [Bacteroidetes bacterium]|nr:T9SS type A sorting domain-containing protein [Bacteroidota bacterium]
MGKSKYIKYDFPFRFSSPIPHRLYSWRWWQSFKNHQWRCRIFEQNSNTNSFSIYPSPCNGKFTINFELNANKSKSIYICTTAGKLIYKKENIIDNIVQVDLSKEAKGIYFVKVVQQNNVMVGKVIIE